MFVAYVILTCAAGQAKENADELVAQKKDLDAKVAAKRAEAKEMEASMRQKASTVGNIVGKDVPVSLTEVRLRLLACAIAAVLMGGSRTTTRRSGHGIRSRRRWRSGQTSCPIMKCCSV